MFRVVANNFELNIEKIDESYKFSIQHEYTRWTGSSFLKNLSYVMNFEEYISTNSITIKRFCDNILVSLPLPRMNSHEVVQLTKQKNDIILILQKKISLLELELQNYTFPESRTIPVMVDEKINYYAKHSKKLKKNKRRGIL